MFHFVSLTTDNASVNDVIVETTARCLLQRYNIPFTPDMHIRCIAHVINLIVQAFLAGMDEADDPDILDYYTLHKDAPVHYDVDDDEDQQALEAEEIEDDDGMDVDADDMDMDDKELTGHQSAVKKVSCDFLWNYCLIYGFSYVLLQQRLYLRLNAVQNFAKLQFRSTAMILLPRNGHVSWWFAMFVLVGITHMP